MGIVNVINVPCVFSVCLYASEEVEWLLFTSISNIIAMFIHYFVEFTGAIFILAGTIQEQF